MHMADTGAEQAQRNDADPAGWPALMRRAQDGDRTAYRRLLVVVTPLVRAIASRFLFDRHDVEDAVQDILMTVHAARHTYDPDRPFKPWLAGVARHRLMDRLRGKRRITEREVTLTLEHETFAVAEPNTDAGVWDGPALRAALGALPAAQQQAIELLKLREMSLKEASVVSGRSVASLKVATHRGLAALRRMLNGRASG